LEKAESSFSTTKAACSFILWNRGTLIFESTHSRTTFPLWAHEDTSSTWVPIQRTWQIKSSFQRIQTREFRSDQVNHKTLSGVTRVHNPQPNSPCGPKMVPEMMNGTWFLMLRSLTCYHNWWKMLSFNKNLEELGTIMLALSQGNTHIGPLGLELVRHRCVGLNDSFLKSFMLIVWVLL